MQIREQHSLVISRENRLNGASQQDRGNLRRRAGAITRPAVYQTGFLDKAPGATRDGSKSNPIQGFMAPIARTINALINVFGKITDFLTQIMGMMGKLGGALGAGEPAKPQAPIEAAPVAEQPTAPEQAEVKPQPEAKPETEAPQAPDIKPSTPECSCEHEDDKVGEAKEMPEGFVWRAKSKKDGKLVIRLPQELSGDVAKVQIKEPNGDITSGEGVGIFKLGRENFRFDQAGGKFEKGSTVVVTMKDGSTYEMLIDKTKKDLKA